MVLVFGVGYHVPEEICIIMVVFSRPCNALVYMFRDAKTSKILKGCVFCHGLKFGKKDDSYLRKKYLGYIFHTWKIHSQGVICKSFYVDNIQPEIHLWHICS